MPLYVNEEGTPVTTQSMMKTFLGCPREAYYKYQLRLEPKVASQPLTRGKWFHALLEAYYLGQDWEAEHQRRVNKFAGLSDSDKENLGDLPGQMADLMKAYIWHYGAPEAKPYDWKVHEVEKKLEATLPNGHVFRGVMDMLVEDDYGLWIVDHKTHKRLPDWNYRMLDVQSPMYIWLCHQNDIPVSGFIWNYVVPSSMSVPKVLKSGKDFYAKDYSSETDYPTFRQAVLDAKEMYPDTFAKERETVKRINGRLSYLKGLRWQPGAPQVHPMFRRDMIEKADDMLDRVVAQTVHTSDRMHSYDFSNPDSVERNVNQCKSFMCSFKDLTMTDLIVGDSDMAQQRNYRQMGDPLAYQNHERK